MLCALSDLFAIDEAAKSRAIIGDRKMSPLMKSGRASGFREIEIVPPAMNPPASVVSRSQTKVLTIRPPRPDVQYGCIVEGVDFHPCFHRLRVPSVDAKGGSVRGRYDSAVCPIKEQEGSWRIVFRSGRNRGEEGRDDAYSGYE